MVSRLITFRPGYGLDVSAGKSIISWRRNMPSQLENKQQCTLSPIAWRGRIQRLWLTLLSWIGAIFGFRQGVRRSATARRPLSPMGGPIFATPSKEVGGHVCNVWVRNRGSHDTFEKLRSLISSKRGVAPCLSPDCHRRLQRFT